MSYNLLGYNLISPVGYGSYGMGMNMMANSLYMMNFCNQLKNYCTGSAVGEAKGAEGTAAGSGTAGMSSADFQSGSIPQGSSGDYGNHERQCGSADRLRYCTYFRKNNGKPHCYRSEHVSNHEWLLQPSVPYLDIKLCP